MPDGDAAHREREVTKRAEALSRALQKVVSEREDHRGCVDLAKVFRELIDKGILK